MPRKAQQFHTIHISQYTKCSELDLVRIGNDISMIVPKKISHTLGKECKYEIKEGHVHAEDALLSLNGQTIRTYDGCSIISCGGIIIVAPVISSIGSSFSLHLLSKPALRSRR